MRWDEIRVAYPDQWIIIEALSAHTTTDHQRHLDAMVFIEKCTDGKVAFARYRELHKQFPTREFYFVQTSRNALEIQESYWLGIRGVHETSINR